MECAFKGINSMKCVLHLRCQGIYKIIEELGGDPQFAHEYSKYVWRRSLINKLHDVKQDPVIGVVGLFRQKMVAMLLPVIRFLCPDQYGIESKIHRIEKKVRSMEQSNTSFTAMDYFTTIGKAYGVIFKYCAVGARAKKKISERMDKLGEKVGALIALRDSYLDLKRDLITGSYNPFSHWNNHTVKTFYAHNARLLSTEIKQLTLPSSQPLNQLHNPLRIRAMQTLVTYASFAVLPIASCRAQKVSAYGQASLPRSNIKLILSQNDIGYLLQTFWQIFIFPFIAFCCFILWNRNNNSEPEIKTENEDITEFHSKVDFRLSERERDEIKKSVKKPSYICPVCKQKILDESVKKCPICHSEVLEFSVVDERNKPVSHMSGKEGLVCAISCCECIGKGLLP
ncbi:MAG: DUF5685 family protein [Promethearchaeota archaeon]